MRKKRPRLRNSLKTRRRWIWLALLLAELIGIMSQLMHLDSCRFITVPLPFLWSPNGYIGRPSHFPAPPSLSIRERKSLRIDVHASEFP